MRIHDFACIDTERDRRTGVPEVIIAEGKRLNHLLKIAETMTKAKNRAIVTRAATKQMEALVKLPFKVQKYESAGMVILTTGKYKPPRPRGLVGVICAGTSDYCVAEEARIIAEQLGCRTLSAYDVGVAGVHRLFEALEKMIREKVDVYIAVAGREGALPTLVAGMVDAPVIGVPVSTGYGMAGKGRSALYAMLQSCSPLVVVNIDAGFVAGAVAARIASKGK